MLPGRDVSHQNYLGWQRANNHKFIECGQAVESAFKRTHALHEYIKNIILLWNLEREKGRGVE
jgi:hypothetical protein